MNWLTITLPGSQWAERPRTVTCDVCGVAFVTRSRIQKRHEACKAAKAREKAKQAYARARRGRSV